MTGLLARVILVFAIFAGTFHAPAMAHPQKSDQNVAHGALTAIDALSDLHDAPNSSSDGTGESLHHHHHCPAALSPQATTVDDLEPVSELALAVRQSAHLSSFSQAPPTQPPSA